MWLVNIILIVSFILQGILSNFINIDTNIFNLLFPIVALIIIYPYFRKNNSKYFICAGIYGFLYDLIYTDTFVLYAGLFIMIGFIISILNIIFSNNIINIGFITTLVIIIYRIITYSILVIVNYLNFDLNILFKSIYSSLLLNIIYAIIIYFISDKISYKYRIEKID